MHWASTVQLAGHELVAPLQRYGVQDGLALDAPAGAATQLPTVPARLQKSQPRPQAVLQHTPSTQLPEVHWLAPEQVRPLACFGTHRFEPLHQWPAAQSVSSKHEVGQLAPPPHTKGEQVDGVPAAALEQVPSCPERLQKSHPPPQAELQHTPSTQFPDWHWPAEPQVEPLAKRPSHWNMPLQKDVPTQSALVAQVVGQEAATPLHRYGAHSGLAPGLPSATTVQVPVVQTSQPPEHPELQHTPSTQKPELHSLPPPQPAPSPFFATQAVPLQYAAAEQIKSFTHEVGHDARAPHR